MYIYPMRIFLIAIAAILYINTAFAQGLKKYPIGKSGCSAYFYCDPGGFELSKSADSSDMLTGECMSVDMHFGLICVKLRKRTKNMDAAEQVLTDYIDFLKGPLDIASAAGYGRGHILKNNEQTRGVLDYWKDKSNNNWKIKGWTDGKYIVFMYVYTAQLINEFKGDAFLNSLEFPGKK